MSCCDVTVLIEQTPPAEIIVIAEQGPAGAGANPADYFQTANNFSELDTSEKKIAARENLELQYIDCGTFN